jgi:hypothetical protein
LKSLEASRSLLSQCHAVHRPRQIHRRRARRFQGVIGSGPQVGKQVGGRRRGGFKSRQRQAKFFPAAAPMAGAPRTTISVIANATSLCGRDTQALQTQPGKMRWSIIFNSLFSQNTVRMDHFAKSFFADSDYNAINIPCLTRLSFTSIKTG